RDDRTTAKRLAGHRAVSGGAPNLALTCQQPLRGPQRSARRSGPVLVILERRLAPSRHFPDRPGDLFPVDRGLLGIFVSFIADIRPLLSIQHRYNSSCWRDVASIRRHVLAGSRSNLVNGRSGDHCATDCCSASIARRTNSLIASDLGGIFACARRQFSTRSINDPSLNWTAAFHGLSSCMTT